MLSPRLHISEVAYAYRGIPGGTDGTGFGAAGPCEVNVACQEGASWQDEQKGIMRVEVKKKGSTFWCSGSLVNNTLQNYAPYVLTADHCGRGATPANISQWIFYFNYQSTTCPNPATEPSSRTMTGAIMKATAGDLDIGGSDFLLLLLDQGIPDTFDVWLNGWNRLNEASPSGDYPSS